MIMEQDSLLMESDGTGISSVRGRKRAADAVETLRACGVVPVIRTSTSELARTAVDWLSEAGMQTFEITLTTPGATSLIADLALSGAGQLIGAGTVTSEALARDAIASGAYYIVSPWVVPEVGRLCREHDVACLMGAMTPTEVAAACDAGADVVKIFPASSVGPAHMKALGSVFPNTLMMPTGGIDASNIGSWVQAGAMCVGAGGKLVDEALLKAGDKKAVIAVAQQLMEAFQEARRL